MNRCARPAALLAINLLYLMVWGFASISKLIDGQPAWFATKFGATILGRFPGVAASFWLVAMAELLAFALAAVALVRADFLDRRGTGWLTATLVMSLFVFLQLGFGQWLTGEFNGGFQQFVYFGITAMLFQLVHGPSVSPSTSR